MRRVVIDGVEVDLAAAGLDLAQAIVLELPMVRFTTGTSGAKYKVEGVVQMPDGDLEEITMHCTLVLRSSLKNKRR
jgi:hypothetical protein